MESNKRLVDWVLKHTDNWDEWARKHLHPRWNAYERLYYGEWAGEDRTRASERSRLITPAAQQAVEQHVSEISDAVFGQGSLFDVEGAEDAPDADAEQIRKFLAKEFKRTRLSAHIDEAIFIASLYDIAFMECRYEARNSRQPAERVRSDGVTEIGIENFVDSHVRWVAWDPRNISVDWRAGSVERSIGIATQSDEPRHLVEEALAKKLYTLPEGVDEIPTGKVDPKGEKNPNDLTADGNEIDGSSVRLLRWFGLVPRAYLKAEAAPVTDPDENLDAAIAELEGEAPTLDNEYEDLVEAEVVIANRSTVLRARPNPSMMGDRPFIHYTVERRPGRLSGRGIMAKAFNMQRASDAALRMHLDSLAYTAAPVFALDATRLPRGQDLTIYPGRNFLTQGAPEDFIKRLDLGQTDGQIIQTQQHFERMLLQATGTLDAAGMVANTDPNQRGVSLAIALAGIIKRHKRALTNFQENFLIPLVQKSAWRYMQYAPDRIKAKTFDFVPTGVLGMVAREYEQQMLISMLSTLGPDSPIVPRLLASILSLSSLRDRDSLVNDLMEMSKPSPIEQEMQELQRVLAIRSARADVAEKEGKVSKLQAEVAKTMMELRLAPIEAQAKLIAAASNNLPADPEDKDFERRVRMTELTLKDRDLDIREKDIESNERIARIQTSAKAGSKNDDSIVGAIVSLAGVEGGAEALKDLSEALKLDEELTYDKDGNVVGKRKVKSKGD